jgi:hypothetical protein
MYETPYDVVCDILAFSMRNMADVVTLMRVHKQWDVAMLRNSLTSVKGCLHVSELAEPLYRRDHKFRLSATNLLAIPRDWQRCFPMLGVVGGKETIKMTLEQITNDNEHIKTLDVTYFDVQTLNVNFLQLRPHSLNLFGNFQHRSVFLHRDVQRLVFFGKSISCFASCPRVTMLRWHTKDVPVQDVVDARVVFPVLSSLDLEFCVDKMITSFFALFSQLVKLHVNVNDDPVCVANLSVCISESNVQLPQVTTFSGSACVFPVFKNLLSSENLKDVYLVHNAGNEHSWAELDLLDFARFAGLKMLCMHASPQFVEKMVLVHPLVTLLPCVCEK